ncbi:glycerol-3-phosphate dehydrogenase/oxidase [Marinigracilibium pacificum]|uniref:Glycerol-3-phosphate dehydrogenase/oxidase n=1 Tax=Marinigracilibium pacificum TaxID=2729599 RepID=A0A848IXA9_9BACT|nr:glycerol-3-phosphate dehydrogenase/oxidase [Marinigracilibium pacificum]NMM48937.1 glycerol-3-phosphate dehydrogenase/oxidase [Marinigracilibium pacificum]
MKRIKQLEKLKNNHEPWDILIIGGGATGLGIAVDAASRGFKTLLLEQADFAKGTSSRSTKLVHGGVRYLQQGDISLVLEALKERGLMMQNAPHLVRNLSFVIPSYEWWNGPFYTIGLKVYDLMAGKLGLGPSKSISKEETIKALPTISKDDLRGGIVYQDGQFDDARMAISLATTAEEYNAVLMNYMEVTGLIKDDENQMIRGVIAREVESREEFKIYAKSVINATGVFADSIKQMDEPEVKPMIRPSQGIHLVFDQSFQPESYAIMVPETSDGRVMFAVPWYNRVVVGTTDTLIDNIDLEPRALEEEIDFILETAGKYLSKKPTKKDIKSIFAGLRPLAAPEDGDSMSTKEISRHHKVLISLSGLITVIGGKWTTYRKMAEDAVNNAVMIAGLPDRKCITERLPIAGYDRNTVPGSNPMSVYGRNKEDLLEIEKKEPEYSGWLSEELQIRKVQVVWAVREEMARTVEDVLARRTRALLLDARESIKMAPETAKIMAKELDQDQAWIENQIETYTKLASQYYIQE